MKQVLPLIRIQLMEFFPFAAMKNTNDAAARKRARRKLVSTLATFLACLYMSSVYSMGMLQGGLDGVTYVLAPALMLAAGSVLGLCRETDCCRCDYYRCIVEEVCCSRWPQGFG